MSWLATWVDSSALSDGATTALSGVVGADTLLAAAGGVELDLDKSVFLQMAVFALLVIVLKPLLFDPVLKVFALREERTEGAREEARQLQEKAGELLRRYERELQRVNQVAAEERDRMRAETSKLENEILADARRVTQDIVHNGRSKIQREVDAMRFQLGKESERLSRDIAGRVLGREVN